jgi:hypothetical protein
MNHPLCFAAATIEKEQLEFDAVFSLGHHRLGPDRCFSFRLRPDEVLC